MKKKLMISIIAIFCISIKVSGQIKIFNGCVGINKGTANPSRYLDIDGGIGSWGTNAPRITINSSGTGGISSVNTALDLYNSDITTNNGIRLNFSTKKSNGVEKDFVGLYTEFTNRTDGNESADFTIASVKNGIYEDRVKIYSSGTIRINSAYYKVYFGWSGNDPVIYTNTDHGFLGTTANYWNKIYTHYLYYKVAPSSFKSAELIDQANLTNKLKKLQIVLESNLKSENTGKNVNSNYTFNGPQVMELFPGLVDVDSSKESYGVNYMGFIPILIQSIKEQSSTIDSLKTIIDDLKSDIETIQSNQNTTTVETLKGNTQKAQLFQNAPNPFNVATQIRYSLAGTAEAAKINIYDLQGHQIKTYSLEKGSTSISIRTSEFQPGMYLYTLIVGQDEIDTKHMIIE